MTRIEIVVCLLLGIFCIMQISNAAPAVPEANNNVVDEILMRLKQLKQQSEGNEPRMPYNSFTNERPEEIMRVHRTLDNLGGGYLLKRSMQLDPLGGGYLLKRASNTQSAGTFDSLGGGYLI